MSHTFDQNNNDNTSVILYTGKGHVAKFNFATEQNLQNLQNS